MEILQLTDDVFLVHTDALAVIGYKGDCKPNWVTDVKTLYDWTSGKETLLSHECRSRLVLFAMVRRHVK